MRRGDEIEVDGSNVAKTVQVYDDILGQFNYLAGF